MVNTLARPPLLDTSYKLDFPCDSKGKMITSSPAAMNKAPLVYTGADVSRFAYIAMMGLMLMLASHSQTDFRHRQNKYRTYSHDPKDPIRRRSERIACPAVFCGEYLHPVS